MNKLLSNDIQKNTKRTYIYYIIVSVIFNILIFLFTYNFSINYLQRDVRNNIQEYNEVDLSDLCKIVNCIEIEYKNKAYKIQNDTKELYYNECFIYTYKDIFQGRLYLALTNYDLKIKTKPLRFLVYFLLLTISFNIIIFLLLKKFVYTLVTRIRRDDAISMAGKEAFLVNKNMTLLTAHITHEVKTPLAALNSELHEIKNYYEDLIYNISKTKSPNREIDRIILGCNGTCDSCTEKTCLNYRKDRKRISNSKIDDAFEMSELYIDSIYNVLNRMQNFKEIKYSNGNKDIYDLIYVAFNTLSMYHKGTFEYEIDEKLKNKYISEKLNNPDILHIFLNHIKNSLQANATYINISVSTTEVFSNKIVIYMTDNGNGIPKHILPYIFDIEVSSKSHSTNDGFGLFLSKEILKEAGGDEFVQETSNKGTVFKFIIPIKGQTCV